MRYFYPANPTSPPQGRELLQPHGLHSPECFSRTKIHISVALWKAAAQFGG